MGEFRKLVEIMARLRGPGGCEWDLAQTHSTLRQYLLEEAHEVLEAISRNDPELLCEELGDLLLQILFHARIAEEAGQFRISDVIERISEKMIRRHPHVFGEAKADSPDAVSLQWEHIKRTVENRIHPSLLGGIPRTLPALLRAEKISRKASRAGFDWESAGQVMEKIEEEISELKDAVAGADPETIEHELGDLLFAIVNLGRFLRVNPEIALDSANRRFERRFRAMETIARESGGSVEDTDMETLDLYWKEAKKRVR